MTMRRMFPVAVAFSVLAFPSAGTAQPVVYTLVELGPTDASQTFGFGINDSGVAAGLATVAGHDTRAVRTVDDVFTIPPGLDRSSYALAINANGDLAGSITITPWPALEYHAMRYTDAGGVEDLGAVFSGGRAEATAINRYGQVAGWFAYGSGSHAFVSGPSSLRDVGTLGGMNGIAYGINDAGTVVGSSTLGDGSHQAFIFDPVQGLRSLGIPQSEARAINCDGQIAGWLVLSGYSRPFRYTQASGPQDLDPQPFRNGQANAINDSGAVAGHFQPAGSVWPHAFVYSDAEGFVDLNSQIAVGGDGWLVTDARGINNAGEIVAQAVRPDVGFERAVKLIPVDLTPPVIQSASIDRATLWPPDGKLIPVVVSATATDDRDPSPRCAVTAVAVLDVSYDPSDAQITGDLSMLLRAARSGSGNDGRTYEATITCSDASGNVATTKVRVSVPHDLGGD
jgi:probable HAF family extracellular repeat protein